MLMQNEVKKVKVVGIEPKRYTSKKTQQEVMGVRMYFDKESEHVYGIAVREEWVSDDVYGYKLVMWVLRKIPMLGIE